MRIIRLSIPGYYLEYAGKKRLDGPFIIPDDNDPEVDHYNLVADGTYGKIIRTYAGFSEAAAILQAVEDIRKLPEHKDKAVNDVNAKRKRLVELKAEVNSLEIAISAAERACNHVYGDAVSDPRPESVPHDIHLEFQGSDCWPVAGGYHTEYRPRWRRDCKLCGHSQYTETKKPTDFVPDFPESRK